MSQLDAPSPDYPVLLPSAVSLLMAIPGLSGHVAGRSGLTPRAEI